MQIFGVDHIAIDTRDIEESIRFYSSVMGFPLMRRVPNGDTELVYMQVDSHCCIELFDHFANLPLEERIDGAAAGVKHIAFAVDGIDEWNRRLINAGVEFTLPLCDLEHLGTRALLFKDPNGVIIELSQNL